MRSLLLLTVLLVTTTRVTATATATDCDITVIGAGLGGVYAAWRLAVDAAVIQPSKVCIFEAKPRPGGRILSVRDPVPGFEGFTVDLGAYRFHRTNHRHTRLLTESALGFSTQCYTDPLDRADAECGQSVLNIVQTRGKIFGLGKDGTTAGETLSRYSPRITYSIPKPYQWGRGRPLESPRGFFAFLRGNNSVVKEIADRWDELTSQTDYPTAMRIADEIIAAMKDGNYRGIRYSEVSLLQAAQREGMTAEEIQFQLDATFDVGDNINTRVSLEHLGQELVRFTAQRVEDVGLKAQVAPVEKRGGINRRIGMQSIVEKMLDIVTEKGVRLFYGKKATAVRRMKKGSKTLKVTFSDGSFVITNKIIANIGKRDLIALGVDSEPMKSSDEPFRRSVERTIVQGLTKMYCFCDDAWWLTKLNTAAGRTRMATEDLFSMRYHDGHYLYDDPKALTGCRGGMLVSYVLGDTSGAASAIYVRTHNEHLYTPLTNTDNVQRLVPGNMTKLEGLFFRGVHKQLRRVHKSSFAAKGIFDMKEAIPEAEGYVYADWFDMGTHESLGPGQRNVNIYELYTKPAKDLDISLVNEAWGQIQGWAESSLHSAERALFHQYGVPRPVWMDEPFHNSIIRKYNQG